MKKWTEWIWLLYVYGTLCARVRLAPGRFLLSMDHNPTEYFWKLNLNWHTTIGIFAPYLFLCGLRDIPITLKKHWFSLNLWIQIGLVTLFFSSISRKLESSILHDPLELRNLDGSRWIVTTSILNSWIMVKIRSA